MAGPVAPAISRQGQRAIRSQRQMRRTVMWAMVAIVISVLAILADLSPLDPFVPQLGWSPGVLLVVWTSVYLLARGRSEL
jgi:hypothetical protein